MADNKKRLEEMQRLLNEINNVYSSLNENSPFGNDAKNLENSTNQVKILEDSLEGVNQRASVFNSSLNDAFTSFKSIVQEIKKSDNGVKETAKSMNSFSDVARKVRDHQEGISILSVKQIQKEQEKLKSTKANLQSNVSLLEQQKNQIKNGRKNSEITGEERSKLIEINEALRANNQVLQGTNVNYNEINSKLKEQEEQEKQIQKNLGVTGGVLKGISKIPILGDVIDADSAVKAMEENLREGGSAVGALGAGLKEIGTQVKDGLFNSANFVLGAFTMILSIIKDLDSGAGDFAKSMNMTYNESLGVRDEMSAIALHSGIAAVNSARMMETLSFVGNQLGSNAQLSNENALQFTRMREEAGMTNEELMGITNLSLAGGKSIKENTKQFMAQAKITGLNNGVLLNEKKLLADIDKVSKATTLSLGKNPKEIAKAVATAKSLGMEMSNIEGMANSLLDFESSIENELSAELLLGKDINLEKARTAALNNDIAGLAKEISNEIGSSAEFTKMNRIQQEALAKAVGMSREDLAQTLFTQEALKGLSGEDAENKQRMLDARIEEVGLAQAQRELEDGSLETMENQQSIQEQFADQMLALKEVLVAGILPVFSKIGGFLKEHMGIVKLLVGLYIAMKVAQVGFNIAQQVSIALGKQKKALSMAEAVASVVKGGWGSLGMIPIVGAALAVAAIGGGIAYLYSQSSKAETKGNDVMSPGQGSAGYGTRTLMGPEGAISLNNKDTVIAGTDLFGGKKKPKNQPQPQGGGNTSVNIDMSQTNALLQQLISVISAGGNVILDGQKVGNALNLGSYKTQ